MSWATALLLAVLQGLTEFLPVSSSGHLVLMQNALERASGRNLTEALAFDLLVHVGTLIAVVVFFRRDLLAYARGLSTRGQTLTATPAGSHNARRELALMGIALIPTAVLGLAFRNLVDALLHRPRTVAGLIGVTGLVLLATRFTPAARHPRADGGTTWVQALGVGAAQGLAVLPGLSRSGLTIAAGLALGMAPLNAFRWSFLISIPAIIGAALLELPTSGLALTAPALTAAVVAAAVALVALRIVAATLRRARFHHFAWYCFAIAVAGSVLFSVWRP